MKVLIADKFPSFAVNRLVDAGHMVELKPELTGDTLLNAMDNTEILVVRSTLVNANIIDSSQNLKLIVRAGAGTNTIDREFARKKSISVCNVPGKNAAAVKTPMVMLFGPTNIELTGAVGDSVINLNFEEINPLSVWTNLKKKMEHA